MIKKIAKYRIEETPCYPNMWKVIHIGSKEDNAACNFFPTLEAAEAEVAKREWHNKGCRGQREQCGGKLKGE